MYESFFGFHHRPFAAVPSVQEYFPAETVETARRSLLRAIERGEGAGLLIGPPGTGKSLVCHLLAAEAKHHYQLARLTNGHAATSRRELLQSILFEMHLPYRGMDEGELRLSLIEHLTRNPAAPQALVLLVDEAQHLPIELLEEIRLLANVDQDGQSRVRVVLVGTAALEEKFAHPLLESFSQRLAARSYLEALDREETHGYIASQVTSAGADLHALFSQDALDQVFRATDGVPRLVNQLCDHALVLACGRNLRRIESNLVAEAWAEQQQLPAPWNDSLSRSAASHSDSAAGVVEFGSLEDDEIGGELPPTLGEEFEHSMFPVATFEIGEPQESTLLVSGGKEVTVQPSDSEIRLFEEEEIVIDRYAAIDAVQGRPCRRVYCVEGLELAELAQLQLREPAADAPQVSEAVPPVAAAPVVSASVVSVPVHPVAVNSQKNEKEVKLAIVAAPLAAQPIAAVEAPALLADEAPETDMPEFEMPEIHLASDWANMHDTLLNSEEPTDDILIPDEVASDSGVGVEDEDLIIVEDDVSEPVSLLSIVSVNPVRRKEFRTLFSRLRRGQPT